ncbi:hypothetical protein SKUN_00551 [Spiroplasma kunkelii CR2-3x]|uniref:Uncharacterized protein n=1 Tax=Spiroplasma kunkelii CR2-3x TaxID=273035 RepID=A0A0K2JGS6_SPIKU|nr:hypothetical protein [Spiroplasma kunkelii]ALA97446.1 hypothetical protein SKUN_00551 [Spiroplasma kunkelii CR2-3x]
MKTSQDMIKDLTGVTSYEICWFNLKQIVYKLFSSVKIKQADWCSFPTIQSVWKQPKVPFSCYASSINLILVNLKHWK